MAADANARIKWPSEVPLILSQDKCLFPGVLQQIAVPAKSVPGQLLNQTLSPPRAFQDKQPLWVGWVPVQPKDSTVLSNKVKEIGLKAQQGDWGVLGRLLQVVKTRQSMDTDLKYTLALEGNYLSPVSFQKKLTKHYVD